MFKSINQQIIKWNAIDNKREKTINTCNTESKNSEFERKKSNNIYYMIPFIQTS